ncbi:hypothetical protein MASR2M74_27570 [Paracoccaceae bacterium]
MAEAGVTAAEPRALQPRGEAAKEWEGLLAPGEQILWQGEPLQGFIWTPVLHRIRPVYLAMAPVALGLLVLVPVKPGADYSRLDVGLIALFWLAVALICYQVIGHFNRRRSFFTLTDQRALIGTRHFGVQSLREVPLFTDTPLRLVQSRWGAVYFARRVRDRESGATVEDGFEGIANPQEPYLLIAELREQRRAADDGLPLAAQPAPR